ncbi:GPN-loop GTPase 2, transcript variant X1 [Columba livia]|uniref:GPN-loop GTPase 2 n=1 Tax=Columba livia TaxID=8932 RepID=A0A2I0LLQ1_COLLI|nr:GPN-loop GTPase 2 isoform X1 [Columba livia]XP_021140811.1 GPN-loop GTPase 2 isoform X1 [Columba livia]PKK18358.1 GPN-loop GTPase 2, transcript variant X2 [Columba livia]PKK18359.1 GPN-loop GTPase 2, transcript variant X1 [Columba livia]
MSEGSQRNSPAFGQVVIGPPGSGKTTYCHSMRDFMGRIGRQVTVVNLDPANETIPYPCAVDIAELVTLPDVMENLRLGPNGGLIYCMEYLEANLDWLQEKLAAFRGHYYLFDCPGQVELYTHHDALKNVFAQLVKWNFRLAAVHLVDSHYCTDPGKFISVLCTSLSAMLHVELPHVNILSKMDLIEQYGKLAFNLDYYTEVLDLSYLVDHLASDPFFRNYRRLNEKLVEVIEDYSLVSFVPLNVQVMSRDCWIVEMRFLGQGEHAAGDAGGGQSQRLFLRRAGAPQPGSSDVGSGGSRFPLFFHTRRAGEVCAM